MKCFGLLFTNAAMVLFGSLICAVLRECDQITVSLLDLYLLQDSNLQGPQISQIGPVHGEMLMHSADS